MIEEKDTSISESERQAYVAGYRACCYNHGIPFVELRRLWKDQAEYRVCVSDRLLEHLTIEQIAQDIAKELKKGYEKYKKEKI